MCTFAEKSALSECSPRASGYLAQKARGSICLDVLRVLFLWVQRVQFCKKLHSLSVAPEPLVFLVQKSWRVRKLKMCFSVVGTCSPRAFSGFFFVEKKPVEGSWFVLLWSLPFAGHGWVLYTHYWASFYSFFLVIFSLACLWLAINTFFVGCGSALSRKFFLQFFPHS